MSKYDIKFIFGKLGVAELTIMTNYSKFFLFIFILFCISCHKTKVNSNEVEFCLLINTPQKYQSRIIETRGIVLGYHIFIFYSHRCLEKEKVIALEISSKDRQQISEAKLNNNRTYQKNFLNNNLYAEITVLGELRDNTEKNPLEIYHPKYKFVIKEIKEINILSEEIYPNENARGSKKVNIK